MGQTIPSARATVLVVEDEPIIRMNAVDMLIDAGFTPIAAADAAEALDQLDAHPDVSVLFTDINMPGEMDGLDLARRVHQIRPEVHLIITSGKVRPGAGDLPDSGEFLEKPYQERTFIALVEAACMH